MMKKFFMLMVGMICFHIAGASHYELCSPDKNVLLSVDVSERISYSLSYKGDRILLPSEISLTLEGGECLGKNSRVKRTVSRSIDTLIRPVAYKKSVIQDIYNELQLSFKNDFSVTFRVYNDGMAYRFETSKKGKIVVLEEKSEYNFDRDYEAWIQYANRWGEGDRFYTTFENDYVKVPLSRISTGDTLVVSPVIVDMIDRKIALLEADVEDYPGMFMSAGTTGFSLKGEHAGVPMRTSISGDEFVSEDNLEAVVKEGDRYPYMAVTEGRRTFPWRAVVIAERDIDLTDNDMVYKLAAPSRLTDVSWIKPGKVAWDWWIECDLWNVDFKSGVNYETYCEYIDFAHENGLEYIIIDVGFSKINDIMETNPDIQIEQLVKYAESKKVGIIAWSGWLAIKDQMEAACKKYSELGIKGFKIDYMNRDDQEVVNFYYDLARTAARYRLVLDFHGAYKPTGLQRTYPNVLSFEAVKGQEWCRWTNPNQPRHAVTVPFVRMLAGPMDFTPGVFRSESREVFKPSWIGSMGQGTRAHQIAMYVVFDSPLQMLSDSPSRYRENRECTDFLSKIPTVWEETIPLAGTIGEYVVMARKTKDAWYVGALTNWNGREISIDFSFLPEGCYRMEYLMDGANADKTARDYKKVSTIVRQNDRLTFLLASGGGWVAKITKMN